MRELQDMQSAWAINVFFSYHIVIVCWIPFIVNIVEDILPSALRASLYAWLERYKNLGIESQDLVKRPVTLT